jgi:HK97 family phage major capsid protein
MANTVFANKIIEAKAKDLLTTAVNTRSLMTVDTTLAAEAGMTKTINVYTYTGEAEELGVGQGNTNRGSIAYEGKDYTVKMIQQAFDYADEDFMKDNTIVDSMLKGANQVMVNKMTSDFIAEVKKASLSHAAALSYDAVVDAIAKLNVEDESGLFLIVSPAGKAALRKDPDYVAARMGEVVYNGQVGTICGIPVIVSKAIEDGEAYIMSAEAVKLFMKKDVEVEQDRDADTRTNSVYLRTAYIVALVDATKICKISA